MDSPALFSHISMPEIEREKIVDTQSITKASNISRYAEQVQILEAMGFEHANIKRALRLTSFKSDLAVEYLLNVCIADENI